MAAILTLSTAGRQRRKLIRGDRDRYDRRKVNLSLTPAGAALMRQFIACAAETNAIGQAKLSDDEARMLLRLLRAVTTSFGKASDRI